MIGSVERVLIKLSRSMRVKSRRLSRSRLDRSASRSSFSPAQTVKLGFPAALRRQPELVRWFSSRAMTAQMIRAILLATATVTSRAGLRSKRRFAQRLTVVVLRRV
jgi:hypothetical protein